MSWLSNAWETATSAVGTAASYTVTYAGAGIAVVGGAIADVADLGVEGAGYIAGKDWDLYEGSLAGDAVGFIADGSANELAEYIKHNPGQALHVAGEGVQQGLGTVTGVAGAAVGGVGGLLADSFNTTVRTVSFGNLELYEGGYGSMAMAGLSQGFETGRDTFVGATDFVMSDPVISNEHDRIIYGAAKGGTEVVAFTVATAATMGAAAPALLGTTGSIVAASVTTKVGLAATLGGVAYGSHAGIEEQNAAYEERLANNILVFGAPTDLEAANSNVAPATDVNVVPLVQPTQDLPTEPQTQFKAFAFGS